MSFTPLFGIAELTKGRQCVETTLTRICWSLTGTAIVNCRSHTGHFYDMSDFSKLILCGPLTQELESLFKKASSAIILMSSCLSQALANSEMSELFRSLKGGNATLWLSVSKLLACSRL